MSTSRSPQAQTQPIRRAGLPTTSARLGTAWVTAPPGPDHREPTDVPRRRRLRPLRWSAVAEYDRGVTFQSSARARSPVEVTARGCRSLVRIAPGPMNTPSSTVTPWYTSAAFLDLGPWSPIVTPLVDEHIATDHAVRRRAGAPVRTCARCQMAGAHPDGHVGLEVGGRVDARGGVDHGWVRGSLAEGCRHPRTCDPASRRGPGTRPRVYPEPRVWQRTRWPGPDRSLLNSRG